MPFIDQSTSSKEGPEGLPQGTPSLGWGGGSHLQGEGHPYSADQKERKGGSEYRWQVTWPQEC